MKYHCHVYFSDENGADAAALYYEIAKTFTSLDLGKIHASPLGPHTKPMFEAVLFDEMFQPLISWLMLNRKGLSVLVHPISGDELKDHTEHALWLGEIVPLDLERL